MRWSPVDFERIKEGRPPESAELLRALSVGVDFITDFWLEQYLDAYISLGGSKIKFLTGSPGSGKSHCLGLFLAGAAERRYRTVALSARSSWIHDFKEIYSGVFASVDFGLCLKRCADNAVVEMGYRPEDIPEGMSFADYLASRDLFDPVTRRELRSQLNAMFFKNPRIDRNFAIGAVLITGGILGHPALEPAAQELLMSWLSGTKGAQLAPLRKLGVSPSWKPSRITKYNARHMLRSLVEIIRMAGFSGIAVGIDDMEILAGASSLEDIRYTKMRREDAYESIRELIDEIDTLSHTMFVFAFNRGLIDNETTGFKSYQALWMRIQNEIESGRFNRFSDIIDLDKMARQQYTPQVLSEMSRRLSDAMAEAGMESTPVNPDVVAAMMLKTGDDASRQSMPRLINRMTLGGV
ncbi:MAG: DUF2791 family P-loop domain-containing protein [Synergistaceae bacterium]|jgi:hypothetical protein|nr:DUF2791 family P-loop domain-containing protein [Synergistaceae bacterium]